MLDLIADEVENDDDDDDDEPEVAKRKEAQEEREGERGRGSRWSVRPRHESTEMSEGRDSTSTPRAVRVATESSGQATKRRRGEQTDRQKLPDELWAKILESVPRESKAAFALTCKQFRRVKRFRGNHFGLACQTIGVNLLKGPPPSLRVHVPFCPSCRLFLVGRPVRG